MREKNKPLNLFILVLGAILYLFVLVLIGPRLNSTLRPYAGVLSETQVIISILMVVTNKKRGFIVTICLCMLSVIGAFLTLLHGSTSGMTGVLTALSTMATVIIVYTFVKRTESQHIELIEQYEQIMDSDRILLDKDNVLKTLAYTDSMTGLHNMDYLQEQLAETVKKEEKFTLIYMDLDNFKNINDTFGPKIGDAVLKTCAERLRSYCGTKYQNISVQEMVMILPCLSQANSLWQSCRISSNSSAVCLANLLPCREQPTASLPVMAL